MGHGAEEGAADEAVASLRFFGLQAPWRSAAGPADGALSPEPTGPLADVHLPLVPSVKPPRPLTRAGIEEIAGTGMYDYVISITGRTRRRRLHAAGGCYRARAMSFVQYEVFSGRVDPSPYTAVCRSCWKGSSAEMLTDEVQQASEDSTSSSSSDSA